MCWKTGIALTLKRNYKTKALSFFKTKANDLWPFTRHEVCCAAAAQQSLTEPLSGARAGASTCLGSKVCVLPTRHETNQTHSISSKVQKTEVFSRTEGNKRRKGHVPTCPTGEWRRGLTPGAHTPPCRMSSKPALECTLQHQSWVLWFCFDACCGGWHLGASLRWWHQHARERSLAGTSACPLPAPLQPQPAVPSARAEDAQDTALRRSTCEREPRQTLGTCPAAVTALATDRGNPSSDSPRSWAPVGSDSLQNSEQPLPPALPVAAALGPPCSQWCCGNGTEHPFISSSKQPTCWDTVGTSLTVWSVLHEETNRDSGYLCIIAMFINTDLNMVTAFCLNRQAYLLRQAT